MYVIYIYICIYIYIYTHIRVYMHMYIFLCLMRSDPWSIWAEPGQKEGIEPKEISGSGHAEPLGAASRLRPRAQTPHSDDNNNSTTTNNSNITYSPYSTLLWNRFAALPTLITANLILRILRPRIFESKFRNHRAKKLDGAPRTVLAIFYIHTTILITWLITYSPYSTLLWNRFGAVLGSFYRLRREVLISQNWLKG